MNIEYWKRLESRALWLLEHAEQSPPREPLAGMACYLRLWRYPRSGPYVSWSVLLAVPDHRSRRSVVREVSWDRLADWKRRMAPLEALKRRQDVEPAVRHRDAGVTWDDLLPFLEKLSGLRKLPAPAAGTVPRGDAFGLEGHRSFSHLQFLWSGKGPRAAADTLFQIGRLRDLLVRSMREREKSNKS